MANFPLLLSAIRLFAENYFDFLEPRSQNRPGRIMRPHDSMAGEDALGRGDRVHQATIQASGPRPTPNAAPARPSSQPPARGGGLVRGPLQGAQAPSASSRTSGWRSI